MIPDPIFGQTYHGLHHGYAMSGIRQNSACPIESSTFPFRLYKVVEQAAVSGYESVISWLPDGRSFQVHNHDVFVDYIAPSYFSLTKYKSFLRQLTVYGFQRINNGTYKGGYFHPSFVRGKPNLVFSLTRKPCKKNKANQKKMKNSEKAKALQSTTCKLPLKEENENCSKGDETLSSKSTDVFDTKQGLPKTIDMSKKESIKILDHETSNTIFPDTTYWHDLQSDNTLKSSSEDWWITQNENQWDSANDMLGLKEKFDAEDVNKEIISTFSKL